VDARVDGGLLLELYSRDGVGTMISADFYEGIRRARGTDVDGIQVGRVGVGGRGWGCGVWGWMGVWSEQAWSSGWAVYAIDELIAVRSDSWIATLPRRPAASLARSTRLSRHPTAAIAMHP